MRAIDVMTAKVAAVGPETPVPEIARLLLEQGVSAVPVVDPGGKPIGIVSEGDLLRRREMGTERRRSWWLRAMTDDATLAEEYAKAHGLKARDVMSQPVITVPPDMSLPEIVALLEANGIKRVPVVRDGRIIGIVSRANLLQGLASGRVQADVTDGDQAIRTLLLDRLKREPWASIAANNVVVTDGVVHFWGMVASDEERRALRVAAESIDGVRAVEDHTSVRPFIPTTGAFAAI